MNHILNNRSDKMMKQSEILFAGKRLVINILLIGSLSVNSFSAGIDDILDIGKKVGETIENIFDAIWGNNSEDSSEQTSSYNPPSLEDLLGSELVGMCYRKGSSSYPSPSNGFGICGKLPNTPSISFDVCSQVSKEIDEQAKELGFTKISHTVRGNTGNFLKELCESLFENNNNLKSIAGDLDIYAGDTVDGTYKNGETPEKFYKNIVNNVLQNNSIVKTSFMNNNQKTLREIIRQGQKIGIDPSSIEQITSDKLIVADDYASYLKDTQKTAQVMIEDIITSTPLNITNMANNVLAEGENSQKSVGDVVAEAIKKINDQSDIKAGFKIDLNRKDTDLALPLKETINYYRDDLKPEIFALIKDQMRRESEIKAKVYVNDKLRTDIVALVGQKALIMNEKFNREAAKEEIEALLKEASNKAASAISDGFKDALSMLTQSELPEGTLINGIGSNDIDDPTRQIVFNEIEHYIPAGMTAEDYTSWYNNTSQNDPKQWLEGIVSNNEKAKEVIDIKDKLSSLGQK